MAQKTKTIGLAQYRTGKKKPEGEILAAESRLYEVERNKYARASYEKLKEAVGTLGVPEWNLANPRNFDTRNGL
jgi:hypothetical protein